MLCEKLVFDLKKQLRLPQLSRCQFSRIRGFSFCSLLVTDLGNALILGSFYFMHYEGCTKMIIFKDSMDRG